MPDEAKTLIVALAILGLIALIVWATSAAIGCWSAGGTWVPKAFPAKCWMPA